MTTTGSLAGTLGLFQPFRYRGYVYDWETGFYYLQSRYYDPTTGRFISADVLLSTGQGVLGHNCYAYCLGNPVGMVDDEGCAANRNNTVVINDGARNTGEQDWTSLYYEAERRDQFISETIFGMLHTYVVITDYYKAAFKIEDCYSIILECAQQGRLDQLCDDIASTILRKHRDKYGTDFFATKAQLSRETKEHIIGYFWAIGIAGYECPLSYRIYYNIFATNKDGLSLEAYVFRSCGVANYSLDNFGQNIWYYGKFKKGGK